MPAGHQLVADRTHLLGPGLYGPRLGGNDPSELPRTRSRLPRRALGAADAGGDHLVRRPDLVDVVEAVDEVGEAAGAEDHVDGVDATMLVDLDQPSVQARDRERILPAEEEIPLRLEPEESRQSVELAAVKSQIALERRQSDRDVADAAFEAVDSGVDRVDLGRELLRTLLRGSDASVQRRQPGIDGMLAAVDVSRCRRCDHSRKDGERCQGCKPHQRDFREAPGRPCTGVVP